MQGFDILFAAIVSIIVSAAFKARCPAPYLVNAFTSIVRIILMFGAFPDPFTYYWRMRMPETTHYTALIT
ncbi:hypothetical protein ACLOJK_017853 [Asimina triloba]